MRTLAVFLFAVSLSAQITITGGSSSSSGGTVTSITAGCGLSGGAITTSGTIAETVVTAAHNGSYAVLTGDCGKSLTTNTAAAWTVAQAGTAGFAAGWFVVINNVGAGSLTLTATTSTFYGGPSANISGSVLTIPTLTSASVISDGTNYQVLAGGGGSSGAVIGTSSQITVTGTCNPLVSCTISIPTSPALPGSPTTTTQSQNDNSTKLATTAYTDLAVSNAIAGVNPAIAVIAASTGTVTGTYSNGVAGIGATFTVTATGAFTLDGIAINTIGQRVLLKNQSSAFQNGVYTATVVGASLVSPVFTRALDYDTPSDINSTGAIPVQSGTANSLTSWLLTSTVTTVGTDALTYTQFSYSPNTSPPIVCTLNTILYTNSSFQVAGTQATITLATLGSKQYVSQAVVDNLTGSGAAFAGTSITNVQESIGSSGSGTAAYSYFPTTSIFTQGNAAIGGLSLDPAGSSVIAVFTSTGANFGNGATTALTAGNVRTVLCTTTLP